jgi:DNA-binding SARP family transcriptional activator
VAKLQLITVGGSVALSGVNGLRFNILGPLEGWAGETRLHLGGQIQQRILGALLLESGRMLPVPRLVEAAWDDDPPATAAHQVRKAVADLRRRIPEGERFLVTDGPGYAARASEAQLDLSEFDARVREARSAAAKGSALEAVQVLRSALALWRGPVLSGVGSHVVEAAATVLNERHLAAVERYFDLRLALGDSSELVSGLHSYVRWHPLQETLRGQLMLALYRSGRRAEALTEYGRAREHLAEELGIDPGPKLTKLYERILVESPALVSPEPAGSTRQSPDVVEPAEVPRTLPVDISDFVGRDYELRQLVKIASAKHRGSRIIAIDGMGGSGKTSLAVRAAYQLADEYLDGQLYVDLRGYTPDEQPLTAAAVLESLLRALGLPRERIPEDAVGRTVLWRSTVAGKRLLLVLDNVAEPAEAARLIPTSPACLVLITSRARLVDLDGAEWISLGIMTPEESEQFIAEVLGEQRSNAEPEAVTELAGLCGYLPLALRIATARLRNRPHWSLAYLAERLRDENRTLDELTSGARGVATTLRLSYQALAEGGRTAFRILALHPGRTIDIHAAAALLASDLREAEDQLETLLDEHLVEQPEAELYSFHDLVRSFARSLPGSPAGQGGAEPVERLLDYYLTASESACQILFPGRSPQPAAVQRSTPQLPDLSHVEKAQAWFAREHTTLTSAVNTAVRTGLQRHAVGLARNTAFYLNSRGLLHEFAELSRTAVTAARALRDSTLLCTSLSNLGVACWKLGLYDEGVAVAQEGRELAVLAGDRRTQAHCEGTLGLYMTMLGRFPEALRHLELAVAAEHELGAARAEAESLTVLSALYEQWGRYEEAAEAARRAVELVRQLGQHENGLVGLTDLAWPTWASASTRRPRSAWPRRGGCRTARRSRGRSR